MIFHFKKSNFPFQKSEIPLRFRFIIGKVEFDEITIYRKKTMKLSLVFQSPGLKYKNRKTMVSLTTMSGYKRPLDAAQSCLQKNIIILLNAGQ